MVVDVTNRPKKMSPAPWLAKNTPVVPDRAEGMPDSWSLPGIATVVVYDGPGGNPAFPLLSGRSGVTSGGRGVADWLLACRGYFVRCRVCSAVRAWCLVERDHGTTRASRDHGTKERAMTLWPWDISCGPPTDQSTAGRCRRALYRIAVSSALPTSVRSDHQEMTKDFSRALPPPLPGIKEVMVTVVHGSK